MHLQSIGKYVKAANLVQYLSDSLVQKYFGMKSTISLATAKRWMHTLGYRWLRVSKVKCQTVTNTLVIEGTV